jgi:hypothetical protein
MEGEAAGEPVDRTGLVPVGVPEPPKLSARSRLPGAAAAYRLALEPTMLMERTWCPQGKGVRRVKKMIKKVGDRQISPIITVLKHVRRWLEGVF